MKNVINRALVAKKKIFLTLVLAIVSSLWMMSEAGERRCMPTIRSLVQTGITTEGTFQVASYPCREGEECPSCLSLVLETNDKTYYLVSNSADIVYLLENVPLGAHAIVQGQDFDNEGIYYLCVSNCFVLDGKPARINSLCDKWNILEISNVTCGGCEAYRTFTSKLTTDTIINKIAYARLIEDGVYRGALRESYNRICYIPAGSSYEYLLYAFNVHVGDVLGNVWIGESFLGAWTMTVEEIQETTPRTFVLSTRFIHPEEGIEALPLYITWIEGVGLPDGPVCGKRYETYADSRAREVLCAYKKGEQIYVSEAGKKYGCEYNYNPSSTPTDTIPLYVRDDSGTSTVDPVDPNQIYATHTGNELAIHNNTGANVTITINTISRNNAAARVRKNTEPITFTDSISVELSEEGEYEIILTSEEWNYTIFGTFIYSRAASAITKEEPLPIKKVLRGKQILIEREGKTYTITGQEIK